jgi:hypothetical protein
MQTAAFESILDSANRFFILGLEQLLPSIIQPALQPADGDDMGARKRGQHSLEDREREDQGAEPGRLWAHALGGSNGPLYDGGSQEGDHQGGPGNGGRDWQREQLNAVESVSE